MKKSIYLIGALFLISLLNPTLFGQDKKVLFEEFTNASCGPCAANNPFLKDYILSKGDTIVSVMYHTNFPGFDPMHNANPVQVEERRTGYYSDVNAVPWLKGDGDLFPDIWPFTLQNFDNAFNTRKAVVPKITMTLTDQRLAGDTIRVSARISIPQNLPAGDYKLRVMAVESVIEYATPPGSNGERIFEYVFRKGYPNMQGTSLSANAGNYEFVFKYKIEPAWNDTNIYTIAFVQNDAPGAQKEVLNCAKAGSGVTGLSQISSGIPEEFELSQNYPNPFNPQTRIRFSVPVTGNVKLRIYNSLGVEVNQPVSRVLAAGSYQFIFNASGLPGGVYFYTIESGAFKDTKKMILLK